jgi:3-dehydroquinate dehydratase/shikimate dehydrogenase
MNKNRVRICVPVCVESARQLELEMTKAANAGDLIEIRFDCLESSELEQALKQVAELVDDVSRPLVITFRPAEQGGKRALDLSSRIAFWSHAPRFGEFFDIELDLALAITSAEPDKGSVDWQKVICSHHDFVGIPGDLEKIYEQMISIPARILKIAVQADDITDCIRVLGLLELARRDGREMIAVAMGSAGIMTRILGPSRGAFLTYGALAAESATAPGQPTAKELRELYRLDQIHQQTEIMGLVGLPVSHSVSPHMLNAAFAVSEVDAVYIPFAVRDLSAFVKRMVHARTREIDWNLRGLSVTAPHKTAIIDHLDWIEPSAKEIGAVNTIVIAGDELLGYNTDAMAVLRPVSKRLGALRDSRCAVIGAGGAASAVLWSLKNEGAQATVFARDREKGSALAQKFDFSWEQLEEAFFKEFDFVVNATPLGTQGVLESETAANVDQLRGARLAYDLVYNPSETLFLRQARDAGCDTIGGLPMLVLQAAEQFKLWTGLDAPVSVMREAAGATLDRGFENSDLKSET